MAGSSGSDSNPSGVQGICPTGWHLPSSSEWEALVDHLGDMDNAGGRLKATRTLYWKKPNYRASNASGFTALPGGHRNQGGTFSNINEHGYWWTATDNSVSNFATIRMINYDDIKVDWYGISKEFAYSIRCVKDDVNVGM